MTTQDQIQEMLTIALEHWDFEAADKPFSEMKPTMEGMIDADLSNDQDLIDQYVTDANDWEGLQDYILATMGRL